MTNYQQKAQECAQEINDRYDLGKAIITTEIILRHFPEQVEKVCEWIVSVIEGSSPWTTETKTTCGNIFNAFGSFPAL